MPETPHVYPFDERDYASVGARQLCAVQPSLRNPLVLAISTPAMPIATQLARMLRCSSDILPVVAIRLTGNGRQLTGAVTLDGEPVIRGPGDSAVALPFLSIHRVTRKAHEQVQQWYRSVRGHRPIPRLEHRSVVLTDECLGEDCRMATAIRFVQHAGAHDITVAVPTVLGTASGEIGALADRVVILHEEARVG